MTLVQIAAIVLLTLGIGAVIMSVVWVMLLSGGREVEIGFGEIKEGWRAGRFRELTPILLGVSGIFIASFSVAFVLYAFGAPILVTLLWLGACLYAVLPTWRGFHRA